MAEATVDDVRVVIDTDLTDPEIQEVLDSAARAVVRDFESDAWADAAHQADYEATLAAYWIAGGRDRRPDRLTLGNAQISYSGDVLDSLRARLHRLDPTVDATTAGGVVRNTARFVSSANNTEES